jgi:fumarylacetoacetase
MQQKLSSWVDVEPNSDFSIDNFPFGIFSSGDSEPRAGSAIGEYVIDLDYLQTSHFFDTLELPQAVFKEKTLNSFIALGREKTGTVRNKLIELFEAESSAYKNDRDKLSQSLIPMDQVDLHLPVHIPNYTDFYSSIEHATNVGTMFRDPDNALLPNWKHLPVGYHGRASSIIVSGEPIHRPKGQTKAPEAKAPSFGPTKRLDFELEMAFITCSDTELGTSLTTDTAEDNIFGFVLFNDWSARDVQVWEYVPLGPFLAKNFASSISPWIVTMDALEHFRTSGPKQVPEVLPYLQYTGDKNLDINLEVGLETAEGSETIISRSNFKYMYWNPAQQLAHHTVNGCNLQVGDMYASGTISGPTSDSYGSMLELAWKGTKPITLDDGSERKFIHDGDTVKMRGFCEKEGIRIGFGEVSTKVLPSI